MTRNDHHSRHGGSHAGQGEASHHHRHASSHDQQHSHATHHQHRQHHQRASHDGGGRRRWGNMRRGVVRFLRRPLVRRMFWGTTVTVALAAAGFLALWWRLSIGPIEFDVATPWLKAAIEDNFGGQHTVSVGGTQLERDEDGHPTLRLRDIEVRDADGTVVASAPKAEVGISGASLLRGQMRARSLNLVGAETSVRIEDNGTVTVFAGANKRPIAVATPPPPPLPGTTPDKPDAPAAAPAQAAQPGSAEEITALIAWLDSLAATGLDGRDLRELGLKNGSLTVDDQRSGKRWTFQKISAILTRPDQGGLTFRLASEDPDRSWVLSAAMRPLGNGVRAVGLEARNVSTADILLALRLNENRMHADLPVSASVRAEVAANGALQRMQGQVYAGRGVITDRDGDDVIKVEVERADVRFNWDELRRTLTIPFQVSAGGHQFTMHATAQASAGNSGVWEFSIARGDQVIDPVILAPSNAADPEGSFAINRLALRGRIDTVRRRIDLLQGDLSRVDTRPLYNIALALTGSLDFSGPEPHLAYGVAATRMPVSILKRLWPVFAAYGVRSWVDAHASGGIVERVVIAGNAPLTNFRSDGPPLPDDGLSVDIETRGTTLRPLDDLPPIRDADVTVRIAGRHAVVTIGRGTAEMPGGRKLNVANGTFEVPDTHPKPSPAQVNFRVDGTVPAAAALLASEGLRGKTGSLLLDPETARGTVAARVSLNLLVGRNAPENAARYAIAADLGNFAADKMVMGRKVEASALRVTANNDGYNIVGDVKINGTPGTLELRKEKDADAELKLQARLDEGARRRLGIDFGSTVSGAIPVTVTGAIGQEPDDAQFSVEADLTPVKIDNLLPGWQKPQGVAVSATYRFVKTPRSSRFEDLEIDGAGVNVKGSVEIDEAGEILSANLPVFALSSGDKASIKADRNNDGVLRVVMRGEVYDGRNFVKSSLAGDQPGQKKQKQTDLDLDIRIGTVAGHNGETLRGLDMKLARRRGHIRTFLMKSKIGRDTPFNGDLRLRASDNHPVLYFETDDAGALFRFTDTYPRMHGGQMWMAMDPPTERQAPQIGTLYVRNFSVRGERALQQVVANAPGQPRGSVSFTEAHADFTRFPGKMAVREGVVRGAVVGATVEGQIDYVKNEVYLRGTFVPFYGINNIFGQIPVVGLILGGGSNEGLLGITYEARGPPGAPRISINPVSAITPGLLRKFIPSPGSFDPNFIPPSR
jgi:hypothetical protein